MLLGKAIQAFVQMLFMYDLIVLLPALIQDIFFLFKARREKKSRGKFLQQDNRLKINSDAASLF